jgi:hypothetical protein
MGNVLGSEEPTKTEVKKNESTEKVLSFKKEITPINETEILNTIWQLSNSLLLEYNNEFLKNDFCNKIAFVYQNKLSKFNVKVLKNIYGKINSENLDNEILLTLQYVPKDDDSFITDTFKENLHEKFWKERIDFDPKLLLDSEKDIGIKNIKDSIKNPPPYIIQSHVNNLLDSINRINSELKPQYGGNQNKNSNSNSNSNENVNSNSNSNSNSNENVNSSQNEENVNSNSSPNKENVNLNSSPNKENVNSNSLPNKEKVNLNSLPNEIINNKKNGNQKSNSLSNENKNIKNQKTIITNLDHANNFGINSTLIFCEGLSAKPFVEKGLNVAVIGNFEDRQIFENLLHL